MMKTFQPTAEIDGRRNRHGRCFLNPRQVDMIDEALCTLGAYGEVRLVLERGRLRFIVTQVSHDALLWQPGGWVRKAEDGVREVTEDGRPKAEGDGGPAVDSCGRTDD